MYKILIQYSKREAKFEVYTEYEANEKFEWEAGTLDEALDKYEELLSTYPKDRIKIIKDIEVTVEATAEEADVTP